MGDFQQQRALAKNRIRRRGIYLLPNLFTTAALFAGFYAIVQAMNGRFDQAAIAIFVAMVLDGLDGRVARLTDAKRVRRRVRQPVRHGVASAPRRRSSCTNGRCAAWASSAGSRRSSTVAGAALRLARFNTMLEVADKRWFHGLAEPRGGGARRRLHLDHRRLWRSTPRAVRWVGVGRHDLRRPHDGQQRALLQLQDDQPAAQRAVRGRVPDRCSASSLLAYQPPWCCSAPSWRSGIGLHARRLWRRRAGAVARAVLNDRRGKALTAPSSLR